MVEPKLDGWRCQVTIDDGTVVVRTRNGRDISGSVPELASLASLGTDSVLDGELVNGAGLPSDFYPIVGAVSAERHARGLTFVAFDVLHVSGHALFDYGYSSRRDVLDCRARVSDAALVTVNTFPGVELDAVHDCCEQLEMEGVVVKRQDASYRPGHRSPHWRKVKCAGWHAMHSVRRAKQR